MANLGILFEGGFQQIKLRRERERGYGSGSLLVRGSGGSRKCFEERMSVSSGVPRNFVRGGVQQITLRRVENGDL